MKLRTLVLILLSLQTFTISAQKSGKIIKTLIVDGQNNHDQWPKITYMMKQYLEETGKFKVDVSRSAFTWKGEDYLQKFKIDGLPETTIQEKPLSDPNFKPDFSKYDLVVCNFGWNAAPWPEETQKDFETFMSNGGGLVVVHAADNSFPKWEAYNKMIALGGWGDRTEKDGPYVYYDKEGMLKRDLTKGNAGAHGPQSEVLVEIRKSTHPIMKGMPLKWMHTKDELYNSLRGPAENMEILATAFSSPDNKGTDRHEPVMLTTRFGKGRVFHTIFGHIDYSVQCVGFITCLQRGSQWAATGKVTIPIPEDFPSSEASKSRPFKK